MKSSDISYKHIRSCSPIISIDDDYVKDHHVCGSKNLNSYIKLLKKFMFQNAR